MAPNCALCGNRNFLAERTTKGGSKIKKKNGGYKLTLEIQEISSWKSGKKNRNTIVMVFCTLTKATGPAGVFIFSKQKARRASGISQSSI